MNLEEFVIQTYRLVKKINRKLDYLIEKEESYWYQENERDYD